MRLLGVDVDFCNFRAGSASGRRMCGSVAFYVTTSQPPPRPFGLVYCAHIYCVYRRIYRPPLGLFVAARLMNFDCHCLWAQSGRRRRSKGRAGEGLATLLSAAFVRCLNYGVIAFYAYKFAASPSFDSENQIS